MKVRKQENVDAFRERILETAQLIMKEDGIEGLSIRKITQRLDYTPGIIYHYFKNKDAIIEAIVEQGYHEIMTILKKPQPQNETSSIKIANQLRNYMHAMLARSDIFMLLLNSQQSAISSQTDILLPDIRKQRKSIDLLCREIETGIKCGEFVCEHVELRAQTIWCATYGLMARICKEHVDQNMQEQLIEEHIQMIIASLRR